MFSIDVKGTRLEFEHSLVSLSKWEETHKKPFFAWREEDTKTQEEMLDYFECMLLTPGIDPVVVRTLPPPDQLSLVEYINENRTATIVREAPQKGGQKENVTSELIYFWLITFQIPFQPTETWHLSRLMTLVRIAAAKNSKPEKRPASSVAQQYREMNEARKKALGTSG